jgi:hypothetical protein
MDVFLTFKQFLEALQQQLRHFSYLLPALFSDRPLTPPLWLQRIEFVR